MAIVNATIHGAISIVNAIATGKGATLGISKKVGVEIETTNGNGIIIEIQNKPMKSRLINRVVQKIIPNIELSKKLQLIPEINLVDKKNGDSNGTIGLRWMFNKKTKDSRNFDGRPGRVGDQPEKGNRATAFFRRWMQVQSRWKRRISALARASAARFAAREAAVAAHKAKAAAKAAAAGGGEGEDDGEGGVSWSEPQAFEFGFGADDRYAGNTLIVDLDGADLTELAAYDLFIIGTGPAGTTVANELSDSGLRL